ncbi:DUF305 domain-containing protein [Paracoccus gahaiensis]|uniref:DUF305 domain-containing protein n=1 Tax=Paracoccus gahaiensis TaxID=1706839 RepID=A0A4U0RP51_9RHOB|nr:DUF305 domain-containing protein [Paracoccus gahaiensis]TJZ89964.1 DUF305 domain-containing protein [Paracoccus gahaiensis]
MITYKALIIAAVAASSLATPLFAQEADFQMPEQCAMAAPAGDMPAAGEMPAGDAPATGMPAGEMPMGGMPEASAHHGNNAGGMGAMMGMGGMDMESMPEHVQENMRRMMVTMPAMHDGMMNEDADVAFACGMIAHHQGAIDMAQVLLEHGDDAEMIKLAGEIIAAQVGEMEQMTTWLSENAN